MEADRYVPLLTFFIGKKDKYTRTMAKGMANGMQIPFAIFLGYLCPCRPKTKAYIYALVFGWQGTNVQKYDGGYFRTIIVQGSSVVKGTLNEVRLTQCVERFASHHVRFSVVIKDPNSKHLGTTVWDASMVLVKFLERNCRKGRFSPSKLKGKRVIELGAGCGVAGFGMALLGCDVVSTDQTEVLPLLMRNVERNTSRIMQTISDPDSFGSIQAAELDWGNETHIKAVSPPFDYIIGTDVVYAEHLLKPLLQTIIALSGPKTTILLGHEIRSTNVHEKMLETWKRHFEVKTVPKAKMDSTYQHPSIQLYIMSFKSQGSTSEIVRQMAQQQTEEIGETETKNGSDEDESKYGLNQGDVIDNEGKVDNNLVMDLENRNLSDWEARRCGAMAARLLRDVKIT